MSWYSSIYDHVSTLVVTSYQIICSSLTVAYDFLKGHDTAEQPPITKKPAKPQTSSLFFNLLPPELRTLIYYHTLAAYTPPRWRNPNTAPWCITGRRQGSRSHRRCDPRLLRACRRMYLEALPSVYAPHTFVFPEVEDAYHFIQQIGPLGRSQLRTVYIASVGLCGEERRRARVRIRSWVDVYATLTMLQACENLQKLWVGTGVLHFENGVGGWNQEEMMLSTHPLLELRGLEDFGFMRGPITSVYENRMWTASLTLQVESIERRIREVVTRPRSNKG